MAEAVCCTDCGTSLRKDANNLNTVEYSDNVEGRNFKAAFTDNTANTITETLTQFISQNAYKQIGGNTNGREIKPPIKIDDGEEIPFTEKRSASHEHSNANLENKSESTSNSYPNIKDLLLRISCSEPDWLLVFAFYESNYGEKTFSMNSVLQAYKTHRGTRNRNKNLAKYWKQLLSKYIRTVKDGEFGFESEGLGKAKKLTLGELGQIQKRSVAKAHTVKKNEPKVKQDVDSTKKSNSGKKKTVAPRIEQERFDLHKNNEKQSLEEFLKEKKPNGAGQTIAVIAYYIHFMNGSNIFTEGQIDYAYKILSIPGRPQFLRQIIINNKNNNDFFEPGDDPKTWKLTRTGEIFVSEKLP